MHADGRSYLALTRTARPHKLAVMHVTFDIPDDLADRLEAVGDLPRRALEALAVEEFRLGHLTLAELRRLLGFGTRDTLDGFLKAHGIDARYTAEDLEQDRKDLQRLGF